MPADSPENKCPDECPECGSEKRWPPPVWTDGESGVTEECWHPWHEKPRCPDCGGSGANEFGDAFNNPCPACGGSGRINTSAEEARNQGDFLGDDLSGEHSCHAGCPCHGSPQVPNRDGPGCVNHGVPDGYWCDHPGCPGTQNPRTFIGGSGRINTSGGEADSREASDARFSVNTSPPVDHGNAGITPDRGFAGMPESGQPSSSPSPDRETGECEWTTDAELARDIATGIGGFWDDEPMGEDPPFGPDDVARAVVEVLVEGRLSPSAAPTNPEPSRSDSEGEGLAARIEELIEVVKGIDETVGSFGYSLGLLNVEGSAGDLEDLEMVLDEAEKLADRARSLLVHKEEA